jgi:hypothetical protein
VHAHADRRLRDVQSLGGAHEVAAGHDLEESAREHDVHGFSMSKSGFKDE